MKNSLIYLLLACFTISTVWAQDTRPTVAILDFEGQGISVQEVQTLTERMRSEITFGEASVDQLRNEQSFIRSTLPITTSAIISGGEAQARITEQAGITSALGTMGSFGMNAAQSGLFRSGTAARTGGRPLSRQIASYSSQRGGYL